MSFESQIQTLISGASSVISNLNSLVNNNGGGVLKPDESFSAIPSYDESTDTWTIPQDTADADGVYKGIYTFALNTACSVINISSVSGHSAPLFLCASALSI